MSNNIFEFLPETPSGKVLNILEGVNEFIAKLMIQYPTGKTPFLHFRKYLIQNIELLNKNREKNKLLSLKFSQLNNDVNYNRQLNFVKLAIENDIQQQQNDVIKESMYLMANNVDPLEAGILSKMPIAPQGNLPESNTPNIKPLTKEQVTDFTTIPSLSEEERRKREQKLDEMLLELDDLKKGGRKKKRQSTKKNKKNKKQSKKSKNTLKRKLKNNKSKRKYKKKGAGVSFSRIRRERQTTPQLPPPPPPRGIILTNIRDLPVAEAIIENPSIATITTNVINSDMPVLNTYSEDRILTVNKIMVEYGFNRLKEDLKKEVRLALLNYVSHKNFVPLYVARPNRIEDKEERQNGRIKILLPGELRILVSEWEEWSVWENVNQNDAIRDLINTLTSPEDTHIMYEYGAEP